MVSGLFVVAACLQVRIYVAWALFKFELFVRVVLDTDFVLLVSVLCHRVEYSNVIPSQNILLVSRVFLLLLFVLFLFFLCGFFKI